MRAALVKNGKVTNLIEVLDGCGLDAVLTGDLPVQIGDGYDGSDFYRGGETLTEQTGLQTESYAIAAEYAQALAVLGVETEAADAEE